MLWRQAIDTLDRETASVELAPLEIIGAGSAVIARITKRNLGEKVADRVKVHTDSDESALELQKKLLMKLYSRAWTGPTATNPDREVLVAATRGVEPKTSARSLAWVERRGSRGKTLEGLRGPNGCNPAKEWNIDGRTDPRCPRLAKCSRMGEST